MWAFILAGLSQWNNELLETDEEAIPFENNNWVANVWEFPLLLGPVARYFSGVTGGVCAFISAGLSQWANELLDTGDKASPLETNNWVSNVWRFPLLRGSVAR